jgi:hypothetical protein
MAMRNNYNPEEIESVKSFRAGFTDGMSEYIDIPPVPHE